jgi:hypothetical protein
MRHLQVRILSGAFSRWENNNGIWAKVLAYVTNRAIMKRLDEAAKLAGVTNTAIFRTMAALSAVFPSKLTASGSPSGMRQKTHRLKL